MPLSPSEKEEEVYCCSQSSAYTKRQNPSFIEEETPFLKHINI
jgi:hypothetical protein